jgi:rod shape-determining protein MreD
VSRCTAATTGFGGGRVTPRRLIAATAAIASALVLQAMLLAPLATPLTVSLPAVLVATVAVNAGASAGISIGFTTGLVADLASAHPAGVLALCWLALGLGCGMLADPDRRGRFAVLIIAGATALAALASSALLTVVGSSGADLVSTARLLPLSLLADALVAGLILAPVRAVLRADGLRAPRPVRVAARSSRSSSRVAADG